MTGALPVSRASTTRIAGRVLAWPARVAGHARLDASIAGLTVRRLRLTLWAGVCPDDAR